MPSDERVPDIALSSARLRGVDIVVAPEPDVRARVEGQDRDEKQRSVRDADEQPIEILDDEVFRSDHDGVGGFDRNCGNSDDGSHQRERDPSQEVDPSAG